MISTYNLNMEFLVHITVPGQRFNMVMNGSAAFLRRTVRITPYNIKHGIPWYLLDQTQAAETRLPDIEDLPPSRAHAQAQPRSQPAFLNARRP